MCFQHPLSHANTQIKIMKKNKRWMRWSTPYGTLGQTCTFKIYKQLNLKNKNDRQKGANAN